jgi:hypothetical protein
MSLTFIFNVLCVIFIVSVVVSMLACLSRFVRAHERVAEALETIARKLKDGSGS